MQQCASPYTHRIQPGDTLYSLAIRYNTTVTRLLELNPDVEVHNLRIGSNLVICKPEFVTPVPPIGTVPPETTFPVPPIGTIPPTTTTPVPPIGVVPTCPDKIRELLMLILEWVAEQYGDDKALSIIESLYKHWHTAI